MSAAALVRRSSGTVFVKRHDQRVRGAAQLGAEHAFAGYLRRCGVPVPAVLRTAAGQTAISCHDSVYEVHAAAPGIDLYRDAMSWTSFTSLSHARAAGAALARLHHAAAGFRQPPRPPAVLTSSCHIIAARDPVAAVGRLAAQRPGLARYLASRRWQHDLARHHLPVIRQAAPLLSATRPQWTHGDWHPSNLARTSAEPDAGVAAVLDLGLANRTYAAHDLAIALERSTISWLDLARTGHAEADLDAIDALLDGYTAIRHLDTVESAALAEVLPVVHLEYALSEIEYFADVTCSPGNADLAYDSYLIGHTRWFEEQEGSALLDHLRRRSARSSRQHAIGCAGRQRPPRPPDRSGGLVSGVAALPQARHGGRSPRRTPQLCSVKGSAMRGVMRQPKGLTYRADFIDEAAEQRLLTFISSLTLEPVTMRGNTFSRTVRHFGLRYDYGFRVLRKGDPIPGELAPVMRRAEEFADLGEGELVEAIINRYPRGASLGWHQDASVYDVIVGVSLGAASTIQFRTDAAGERQVFEQFLESRSAYIMRDEVRDNWQHRIPPTRAERVSLTFCSLR